MKLPYSIKSESINQSTNQSIYLSISGCRKLNVTLQFISVFFTFSFSNEYQFPPSTSKQLRVTFCKYHGQVCEMKKSKSSNFFTTKPFGNYFRKYSTLFIKKRLSSFGFIFSKITIFFLNFHLREADGRDILAS